MRGKMREKTMIEKKVMDWNFEKKEPDKTIWFLQWKLKMKILS